ncbi:MAG: dihydrodipicolinate synthase family protein [Candidatus Acidiferrum sp.]
MDVSGIFAALTTPFAPDGSVSCADLTHNIERYNATGLAGYVVMGSTGESVLVTGAEMDAVLVAAKAAAGKDKKLIAGTGAESTSETIQRTKRAAALGFSIALVKTPHYYKPSYTPAALVSHYRAVADESPIPILLYSIPQFTGIALEAAEVADLAQHENIIGIKDSSGVMPRLAEIVGAAPPRFCVLTGAAASVHTALTLGASGAVLAMADVLPDEFVAVYELFRRGEREKSLALQQALVEASNVVRELSVPGFKYAMDLKGYRGAQPRSPLQPLSPEQKKRVEAVLDAVHVRTSESGRAAGPV